MTAKSIRLLLMLYLGVTLLISWLIWGSAYVFYFNDDNARFVLSLYGFFVPGFIAIVFMKFVEYHKNMLNLVPNLIVLTLATLFIFIIGLLAFSFVFLVLYTLETMIMLGFLSFLSAYLLSVLIKSRKTYPHISFETLPRNAKFWCATIFSFPIIVFSVSAITSLFRIVVFTSPFNHSSLFTVGVIIIGALAFLFIAGGVVLEVGWRAFFLNNLLKTTSPIIAFLVMGVVFSFWLLPLYLMELLGGGFSAWVVRIPLYLSLSFIVAWIFTKNHQNLLVTSVLSTSIAVTLLGLPYLRVDSTVGILLLLGTMVLYGSHTHRRNSVK